MGSGRNPGLPAYIRLKRLPLAPPPSLGSSGEPEEIERFIVSANAISLLVKRAVGNISASLSVTLRVRGGHLNVCSICEHTPAGVCSTGELANFFPGLLVAAL